VISPDKENKTNIRYVREVTLRGVWNMIVPTRPSFLIVGQPVSHLHTWAIHAFVDIKTRQKMR